MPVREGGSYIRDPKTGELRPNVPAAPVITPAESEPTPAGQPAGGDEVPADAALPAAEAPVATPPAAGRRKKG
ncbi:MAG: hypothetical protein J0I31_19250 [Rhizobiales bacterium]|nr:hypothetical protein [Hyphomicrobiales bacterium]